MEVIAHRANVTGKEPERENTLEQVRLALELGFGVETDIRWSAANGFYISHDLAVFHMANDAVHHAALWRERPRQVIALNVKELGCEQRLVDFLVQAGVAVQTFLFDMELLELVPGKTAQQYARLRPGLRLAARVSDRNEPVVQALSISEASVVWLDEFDRMWAMEEDVVRLHGAGKTVYAVSPELHGFSFTQAQARWDDFARWGVDGICTDYPLALCQRLGLSQQASDGKETLCSVSN
jgi:glycerophosphoryl diester phosphodiesterase